MTSTQSAVPSFFFQPVDLRSRQSMTDFLKQHFRYDTMSSMNNSTSYANRIKVHHLGLTREQEDQAFEFLDAQDSWNYLVFTKAIREFTDSQNGYYTIGQNGRSGGYLVLYRSRREDSNYKSECASCGQLSYASVPNLDLSTPEDVVMAEVIKSRNSWVDSAYLGQSAIQQLSITEVEKLKMVARAKQLYRIAGNNMTIDNKCGRCGAHGEDGRVNLEKPLYQLVTMAGKSIDQHTDFSDTDEWSMDSLRNRVRLVQAFDQACDAIRKEFIAMLGEYTVSTETILVPKQVRRLTKRAA